MAENRCKAAESTADKSHTKPQSGEFDFIFLLKRWNPVMYAFCDVFHSTTVGATSALKTTFSHEH